MKSVLAIMTRELKIVLLMILAILTLFTYKGLLGIRKYNYTKNINFQIPNKFMRGMQFIVHIIFLLILLCDLILLIYSLIYWIKL